MGYPPILSRWGNQFESDIDRMGCSYSGYYFCFASRKRDFDYLTVHQREIGVDTYTGVFQTSVDGGLPSSRSK